MRKMLSELTPVEKASLLDPEFITEDEADVIIGKRRLTEPTVSMDEAFAESGYIPRNRRRA